MAGKKKGKQEIGNHQNPKPLSEKFCFEATAKAFQFCGEKCALLRGGGGETQFPKKKSKLSFVGGPTIVKGEDEIPMAQLTRGLKKKPGKKIPNL